MRLSERERKILSHLHMDGLVPMNQIAKRTGIREHVVRYTLERLRARELISLHTALNIYALGLAHHGIFFSLNVKEPRKREALLKYVETSDQVSYLCALGGDFQYVMDVCAPGIFQVAAFLETIASRFGNIFFRKSISTRVRLNLYRSKRLLGQDSSSPEVVCGLTNKHREIDELDHDILAYVAQNRYESRSAVARALGQPGPTVDARLSRLEKDQVVAGYRYLIDQSKLGIQTYLILLFTHGVGQELPRALRQFCQEHSNIRCLVENIGGWDYEITADIVDPQEIVSLAQEISEKFSDHLLDLKVVPLFQLIKVADFPFKIRSQRRK